MTRLAVMVVLTAIILNGTAPRAHAYVDPGSTSLVWQFILGSVAVILVVTHRVWQGTLRRARRVLRRERKAER